MDFPPSSFYCLRGGLEGGGGGKRGGGEGFSGFNGVRRACVKLEG